MCPRKGFPFVPGVAPRVITSPIVQKWGIEKMTRVPIHCCCEPARRLGYLAVEGEIFAGKRLHFAIFSREVVVASGTVVRIELEIARLNRWGGERLLTFLAVKSGNVPAEILKSLPGYSACERGEEHDGAEC